MLLEAIYPIHVIDNSGKEIHWPEGERREWEFLDAIKLLILVPGHLKVILEPAKEERPRVPNNGKTPTTAQWELALDELLKYRDEVSARVGIIDERLLLIALAFSLCDAAFIKGDFVTFLEQSKRIKELKESQGSGSNI